MTSRLRTVREPPLLTPSPGEKARWLELPLEYTIQMKKAASEMGEEDRRDTLYFLSVMAAMNDVGVDVSRPLSRHHRQTMEGVRLSLVNRHWDFYIMELAFLKRLGSDVDRQIRENWRRVKSSIWMERPTNPVMFDWGSYIPKVVAMKRAGIDVSDEVRLLKEHDSWVRGNATGHRRVDNKGYAGLLVDMKVLGFDVSDEVKTHEAEIRKNLAELLDQRKWLYAAQYAADMKELGLLTPNHEYPLADDASMPPLRRFSSP